ncbi:hypothetical protein HOQ54_gp02 [uncultured phage MedDCM-OCT-S46-C10]|uniref:Uncharacterized protein n=1 Tax=uncultured phage MedDCM-OCT-S46-C10 TaxID=2741074 RepID=A0A6S4PDZ4_9CAUD|nr:hypothetical protein HOQ54_gp02 [uncultured phage_MedDCM-OCT-S46-C10]BAQ94288.1 hypothetical protein [uncultured phage_MedDCM-OCT-S46-C10]
MTKARDLANIISGGFTVDDIPNIPASKITSGTFADDRLPSTALNSNVDLTNLSASNLTSGTIPTARITALPSGVGGKILQVVHGTSSTEFTETSPIDSTTYYPSSNKISLTITPTSTSSKIIINAIASLRMKKDNQTGDMGIALVIKESISSGSTTELYPTSNAYDSGMYITGNVPNAFMRYRHNEVVYRTPSTTNAITYEVGMFAYASNLDYIDLMQGNSRGEITAYEVQG